MIWIKENVNGEFTYQLHINDPTGRFVFWSGLLILPIVFSKFTSGRYTWINLPLFVIAWYILSAIFGSHANHRCLDHPPQGFISFFEEFDPFVVAVFMWLTQLIVLLIVRGIIKRIRKSKDRKDTTI